MSTPIETNTEELQEILNTVYALPDAESVSSAPDLVIGLNVSNTKVMDDSGNYYRELGKITVDDVSIINGSISSVAEKVRRGVPVKLLLRDIHFYADNMWYQNIGEANHVMVFNRATYPNENATSLVAVFYLSSMGISATSPSYVRFAFDIATGNPTDYLCNKLAVE